MREVSNEMREFLLDLGVFANMWIDEVQNEILKHVDELFNDEAIRFLVHQYAEETRYNTERNKDVLLHAYEYEWGKIITNKNVLYNHKDALYQLCYKRYVKEQENAEKETN
jgi:proteasome lid subunit RPN8/RPN11